VKKMAEKNHVLDVKAAKAARKPTFIQRNNKKKKLARVRATWKRPRGLHNKLRRKRKGIGAWVSTGYKMPVAVRGFLRSGLKPVLVTNLAELKKLDPAKNAAIVSAATGKKNKIAMLKKATSMKLTISNIKDATTYVKNIEDALAKKRETKKSSVKKKEEKESKKKAEKDKSKKEKKKVEPEDANKEKKELDKLLTKGQ
jgi:large subunit ribosomal protein L32e